MAGIEELKKRLYKEGESFGERLFEPELKRPRGPGAKWKEDEPLPPSSPYFYWILGGIFVLLIAGAALFFFGPLSVFEVKDVEITITGDREIKSGARVTWRVQVDNRSNKDLEEPILVFNFPAGAQPLQGQRPAGVFRVRKELQPIKAGGSVSEVFDAYVFGGRETIGEISAVLEYRPKGMSAIFGADGEFSFRIARSPVSVSVNLPKELRGGQKIDFTINYTSQADEVIKNLYLSAIFPEGFEFLYANPQMSSAKDRMWKIGDLKPGESGKIQIGGTIKGIEAETKVFRASLGQFDNIKKSVLPYDESVSSVVLRSPFMAVTLLAKDRPDLVAFPGDTIVVAAQWKNNLDREVKNAILEVKLDGAATDFRTLRIERGVFKEATKSVTWNAATLPDFKNIAPAAGGVLNFEFQVKPSLPLSPESARHVIKANAVFKSGSGISGLEGVDVSGSSAIEVKIGSRLQLVSRGMYSNSIIPNSGPIPPKVGEETTYTAIWSIANMVNDLESVVVSATLPPYINFKEIVSPGDANIVFNSSSGEIEWRVGRVPAGTGFLKPALQVAFQIGIVPSESQIGSSPILVDEAHAKGRDTFTDSELSATAGKITTGISDDQQIGFSKGAVVP